MRLKLLVIGLCSLSLVACGGERKSDVPNISAARSLSALNSPSGPSPSTPSPSTPSPSTPTTAPQSPSDAADDATAKKWLLTADDVPADWVEQDPDPDTAQTIAIQNAFNNCVGEPENSELLTAREEGSWFVQSNNTISSEARAYKTEALAAQDSQRSSDPKYFSCLSGVYEDAVRTSVAGDANASVSTQLAPLSGVTTNAQQFAVRATTTVKTGTQTLKLYEDVMGFYKGRFGVSVNVQYVDNPPAIALDKALLAAVVAQGAGTPA